MARARRFHGQRRRGRDESKQQRRKKARLSAIACSSPRAAIIGETAARSRRRLTIFRERRCSAPEHPGGGFGHVGFRHRQDARDHVPDVAVHRASPDRLFRHHGSPMSWRPGRGAGVGYGVGNIFADGGPEAMAFWGGIRRLRPGVAGALLDARIHPLRRQGRPYRRHGAPDRRQGRAGRPGPDRLCAAGGDRALRRSQHPVRHGSAGEGRDRRHHRPDRRHCGLPADPRPAAASSPSSTR